LTTQKPVRVRFAPSPTGYLHVGGARTALFNWLFARRHGGVFIVRIEDTDRNRYQEDALEDLLAGLRWLGLDWDEGPVVGGDYGPYFQSERTHLYQKYTQQLIDDDRAYYCYCTSERLTEMRESQRAKGEDPGYDRHCRNLTAAQRAERAAAGAPHVVRFKAPLEGKTTFTDAIRGDITIDNRQLDDLVLLKSDGYPTYHLANIIDDHLMEISHIMRADEWLPSVPKHVLLYEAFGWQPPIFAHLPLILDPDGQGKMSKRKKRVGDQEHYVLLHEFKAAGYLPAAMVNFLTLVGWSLDDRTQSMSREMATDHFDLDRINKSPAAFSYDKLDWMNAEYIRQMPPGELAQHAIPFLAQSLGMDEETLRRRPETVPLMPLIRERVKRLTEIAGWIDFAYSDTLEYDAEWLVAKKMTAKESHQALLDTRDALAALERFETADIEATLRALAERREIKIGQLLTTLRIAATGKQVSPPLFESLEVLGKARTLERVDVALKKLATLAGETMM
jgi:glutamyl-tRNA synthetase